MTPDKSKQQQSYLGPFITMVILFFFVGFLTTANGQFQVPLKEAFLKGAGDWKNTFAALISFSWFMAYPATGWLGSRWVNQSGYKKTLVRALLIMVAGLAIFASSSLEFFLAPVAFGALEIPTGFFVFLLGSFIVGSGATILQVVINPYLTACEVKGTQAVQRLNIGGSANSIGTTAAPYFVTAVVFGGAAMSDVTPSQVFIPFLCIGAVIALVTFVVMRLSLPDIQNTRAEAGVKLEKSVWSFSHLTLGVIAIFFYVGVEVAIGANLNLYVKDMVEKGTLDIRYETLIPLMATLYWGGMLVGRLISSTMSRISPNIQLAVTTGVGALLIAIAIIIQSPWLLVVVGLCHSVMWGAIFTLSVAKLGKYTSAASGVFMIGVAGGAVIPLFQGFLADKIGWDTAWIMIIGCELFMLYYALLGSKVKQSAEA